MLLSVSGILFRFRGGGVANVRRIRSELVQDRFLDGSSSHSATYLRYANCENFHFSVVSREEFLKATGKERRRGADLSSLSRA